jgi:small nuclear ribonucleoprotein (snRNP)-like protein
MVEGFEELKITSEADWLQTEVLGRRLKFTLKDTREVSGTLLCVDFQGNSVLSACEEVIRGLHRDIGQVVIPAKALVKVEILV